MKLCDIPRFYILSRFYVISMKYRKTYLLHKHNHDIKWYVPVTCKLILIYFIFFIFRYIELTNSNELLHCNYTFFWGGGASIGGSDGRWKDILLRSPEKGRHPSLSPPSLTINGPSGGSSNRLHPSVHPAKKWTRHAGGVLCSQGPPFRLQGKGAFSGVSQWMYKWTTRCRLGPFGAVPREMKC